MASWRGDLCHNVVTCDIAHIVPGAAPLILAPSGAADVAVLAAAGAWIRVRAAPRKTVWFDLR